VKRFPAFLLLLVSLGAYLPSVKSGFVNWDDPQYVAQNSAELAAPLFSEFAGPSHGYYHPLTILSYKIDYRLCGPKPSGYHLTNTILHTANVVLLFAVCSELGIDVWAAFLAALLFCVHPLMSEPVLWISGRKDLLLCFFGLLSLLSYLRLWARPRMRIAITSVLAVCAVLSKPTGIAIPVMLILVDYLKGRKLDVAVVLEKLPALVFGAIVVSLSFFGREPLLNLAREKHPLVLDILSGINNLWFYFSHIVSPSDLSPDYPYSFTFGVKNLALFPAAALGVCAFILLSGRAGVLCGGIFLLGLLPVIANPEMSPADRYAYFPACGLAIWLGFGLSAVRPERARKLVFALALCAALALLPQALIRRVVWRDNVSLWKDAYLKYPCAQVVAANYSGALTAAGFPHQAVAVYEDTIARGCVMANKDKNKLAFSAGLALALDGDTVEAEKLFLRITPDFADYHQTLNNLGMIYLKRGDNAAAEKYFQSALRLNPSYATARENLQKIQSSRCK